MAKKFTKVMSLLLAMVMVFSMLGVTAMAYDGPNQVGDYLAYDSKGTSGDYTQESLKVIENDMVTLSKTIAQTGENAFDITLEVTTQQNLKDMVLDPNAALCLVFDISNSMLKCGVCGAGNIVNNKVSGTHAAGCTYTGALDATLGSEQTRMTAAVAAAKDLVDTFGATSGKGQRMMSVIFFWTDAKCVQTWVDASKAENRDALKAAIDGATDQVGTNHDAALMLAKNLLDNDEVADINNKYVVLLTDGEPTGFNKAGTESTADDYITGYYNWNERFVAEDHAVESADNLLATGAEVHAICYGTDSLKTHGKNIPVNEWMAANVTSAPEFCYPASNPDALKFNFESIVQQIEERVDLWTVVDPMGDYILYNGEPVGDAFTFADNTLTWDLRVDTPAVDEGKYTYKSDYQVDKILAGKAPAEIKDRAKVAKFDERLALLGLLLDAITGKLKKVNLSEQALTELLNSLKNVRMELARPKAEPIAAVQKQISNLEKKIQTGKLASTLSADNEYACRSAMAALEDMTAMLKEKAPTDGTEAFKLLKADFDSRTKALKKQADAAGKQLSNVFVFCEEVFDEGQEMLILVTELTISYYGAHFISRYGCMEYFNHNKELLFYERQKEIIRELENLELEE